MAEPGRVISVLLLALSLVSCGDAATTDPDQGPDRPATLPSEGREPGREPDPGQGSKAPGDNETDRSDRGELPDLVGKGLQSAQDRAKAAGFDELWSHDATGRERQQLNDRNWQVCFQTPGPGSVSYSTEVDFGAVQLDEECPATDRSQDLPTVSADGRLPDFTGASALVARQGLGLDASIDISDASAQDRTVWIERNWMICTQSPAPGTAWDGEPITFTAVKFGEPCP